jgi:transposase
MIAVPTGMRVMVATKPVDFRRGADGLVALVRETLGQDPFSGTIFVFRSKRAQQATFYIQFSFCGDRVSLAPVVRSNAAGIAIPARQGFDLHLHG